MNDFDWDDESVVFPTTQGVAVYLNDGREVVIRQQAGPCDNEDAFIVIPRSNIQALIQALQEVSE